MLPDDFHRDPADRVLVASARVLGATLAAADLRILDAEIVATLLTRRAAAQPGAGPERARKNRPPESVTQSTRRACVPTV